MKKIYTAPVSTMIELHTEGHLLAGSGNSSIDIGVSDDYTSSPCSTPDGWDSGIWGQRK